MGHVLVTNDDGVDSPAVVPLARALATLGPVEIVVPDRERSWISKAITRHDPIEVKVVRRDGLTIHTTTGYPADCVQLGVHSLFDHPPRLLVSGMNVGFNHGTSYMLSSGTVGATTEAWIGGVPAVAVSVGTNGDWPTWSRWARTEASAPMWERLAEVAVDILEAVMSHGMPGSVDIISINMPDDANLETPRRLAPLARVGYEKLFTVREPGVYVHHYGGGLVQFEGVEGTDVDVTRNGEVAITPIRLPRGSSVPDDFRALLERG